MFIKEGTRHFFNSVGSFVKAYEEGVNLTSNELERRHDFNHRILTPTLDRLRIAGIVGSRVGGTHQGYFLAKPPKEISIADVIKATMVVPKVLCTKRHLTDDGDDCILCGTFNKHVNEMFREYKTISLYDYAQVIRKEEEKEKILAEEQVKKQTSKQKQNNKGIEDLKKVLYPDEN